MDNLIRGHKKMKDINKVGILNIFREKGVLSRIDLTRETRLAGKTITNLTRELLAEQIIISTGYQTSSGGRKPELLELNPDYKYSLGIYLGGRSLEGVVLDLKGNVCIHKELSVDVKDSQDSLLNKIEKLTKKLIENVRLSKLLGIGFAFHGIIDKEQETIISSAILPNLQGTRIKEFFRKKFSVSPEIEASSRAIALGERWFGAAKNIDNFILLQLGLGIGCSVLYQDKFYCGASGNVGEIGHTIVELNGKMCGCGHRGCLETVASILAIEKEVNHKLKSSTPKTFEEINQMALNGNKIAKDAITRAVKYIAITVSNVVNTLNPSYLIISGELTQAKEIVFQTMNKLLKDYTIPSSWNSLQIIFGRLGKEGAAIGAATLLLNKVFEPKGLE